MGTPFAKPRNNASTVIGPIGYTAGSGSMQLTPGGGSQFPALGADEWYRLTVSEALYAYKPSAPAHTYAIYRIGQVAGDTLVNPLAIEGTIDRTFYPNDVVEIRVTKGTIEDLQTAVNALEDVPPPAAPVTKVAGRTGEITLTTADIGGLGSAASHPASDFQAAGSYLHTTGDETANGNKSFSGNLGINGPADPDGGFPLVIAAVGPHGSAQKYADPSHPWHCGVYAGIYSFTETGIATRFLISPGTGNISFGAGAQAYADPGRQLLIQSTDNHTTLAARAAAGQTFPAIAIEDTSGTPLAWFRPNGSLALATLADGAVTPDSLYFSSTTNRLCYCDFNGSIHPLY